jgi:hypothetical protein
MQGALVSLTLLKKLGLYREDESEYWDFLETLSWLTDKTLDLPWE